MISPRIALLALLLMLSACGTSPLHSEFRAELDARRADAVLGEPVRLFDQPPKQVAGLIARDGRAHVFQIDAARVLRHAVVEPDGAVTREQMATLGDDPAKAALDAIEWPAGTLRVAAGSSQFVRMATAPSWRETKGNRCERFLVIDDRLYCAFVMSGEAFGAPKRLDVTGGIIFIVPFAVSSEKTARKLFVAEAVDDSWLIRVVVDPRDPLDALSIGAIGADAAGDVHLLYVAGRGGSFVLVGAGGGGVIDPPSDVRHARITGEALRAASGRSTHPPDSQVIAVKAGRVPPPPWTWMWGVMPELNFWEKYSWRAISPPDHRFSVDPRYGVIEGLVQATETAVNVRGTNLVVEGELDVSLRDGKWEASESVVLTRDWPVASANYLWLGASLSPRVRFDHGGALHALVPYCADTSFWKPDCALGLNYLVKRDGAWSRPVTFGIGAYAKLSMWDYPQSYALLIPDVERSFIGWIGEQGRFEGRWIVRDRRAR